MFLNLISKVFRIRDIMQHDLEILLDNKKFKFLFVIKVRANNMYRIYVTILILIVTFKTGCEYIYHIYFELYFFLYKMLNDILKCYEHFRILDIFKGI